MTTVRAIACASTASALVVLASAEARAVSFSGIDCPRYPSFQQLPATYSTDEMAQDYNRPGHANNLAREQRFFANQHVSRMYLKWAQFNIEYGWDYFSTAPDNTQDPASWQTYTGWISPSTWLTTYLPNRAQQQPLWSRFTTDASVAADGFRLDKIGVSCEANEPYGINFIKPGERVSGVLLGANDSVSFVFNTAGTANGNRNTHFVMWSDTPGTDVDLYVRCNAYPTTDTYTLRGFSSDAQEYVRATPAQCAPGGVWYVTVHNYLATPAQFNLMASYSFESWAINPVVKVMSNSPAEVAAAASIAAEAARRVYGYSEGGFVIPRFDVCAQSSSYCNGVYYTITRRYDCDRSNSPTDHTITLCSDEGASGVGLAHELGHAPLGMVDEYVDVPPWSYAGCGHSIMGGIPWWQNNLCINLDHNRDWDSLAGGPSYVWDTMWNVITSPYFMRVPPEMKPSITPDNVNYVAHDFNGQFVVQQHY